MTESEILSSTGVLGFARRSCDRGYANLPTLVTARYVERLSTVAARLIESSRTSRNVARVFMGTGEIARLNGISAHFEAAVPTGIVGNHGEDVWMCMFAHNANERRPIYPISYMVEQTSVINQNSLPSTIVENARNQGYSFKVQIHPRDINTMYEMWGPVFGWERNTQQIEALRERLNADRLKPPHLRSVWFTALHDHEELVTLAMAERLEFPQISLIELTEWVSNRRGRHLMEATVAYNIAQVVRDLSQQKKPALLIAETNFITSAFRVGHAVGMRVPPRNINGVPVSQLLIQNVNIGDGRSDVPYRDFVMMHVPQEIIRSQYNAQQRALILKGEA